MENSFLLFPSGTVLSTGQDLGPQKIHVLKINLVFKAFSKLKKKLKGHCQSIPAQTYTNKHGLQQFQ